MEESRRGHWWNVNESHDSAHPNVGCALSYVKAVFPQKRMWQSADNSASKVAFGARRVVPGVNKIVF